MSNAENLTEYPKGFIYPQEAEICKKRNCPLLTEIDGMFICQPGAVADKRKTSDRPIEKGVKIFRSQFPKKGCTRNLHLGRKKWRSREDPNPYQKVKGIMHD